MVMVSDTLNWILKGADGRGMAAGQIAKIPDQYQDEYLAQCSIDSPLHGNIRQRKMTYQQFCEI